MISIYVNFDSARLRQGLQRAEAAIPAAIARGLNEGGDKVRTQVQRALRDQTGVKAYRSITSRTRTVRAFAGDLTYQIIETGKGMPIREFPVAVPGNVDAQPWGVSHLFARSFQQKFKGGLRARLGASRLPIRSLFGPALPKELEQGKVPGVFAAAAESAIPQAILKHLARALGS